jgi:hypothetical protein
MADDVFTSGHFTVQVTDEAVTFVAVPSDTAAPSANNLQEASPRWEGLKPIPLTVTTVRESDKPATGVKRDGLGLS